MHAPNLTYADFMMITFWYVSGLGFNSNSTHLCNQDGEHDGKSLAVETVSPPKSPVPVVKAKATSLVNTLMISKLTKIELFWFMLSQRSFKFNNSLNY